MVKPAHLRTVMLLAAFCFKVMALETHNSDHDTASKSVTGDSNL
jgi:hypothetical protein